MSDRDPLQHSVTRRRFVQLGGAGVGAVTLAALVTTRRFASVLAQDAAGGS